jgi:predicted nucleic acid-binding protein
VYWDTSALLKLYVAEPDSPYFIQLAASTSEPIFSSAIVLTEALCALYRKEHAGELKRGAAGIISRSLTADAEAGRFIVIPYGRDIVAQTETLVRLAFGRPQAVMLRALDAIHVASALTAREDVMVATDSRLRAAAALAGLRLLP